MLEKIKRLEQLYLKFTSIYFNTAFFLHFQIDWLFTQEINEEIRKLFLRELVVSIQKFC